VQLADILVHHSVKAKAGEKVLIIGSETAAPLIREIYRKVMQAGAVPVTQVGLSGLNKIYYELANDDQLADIEYSQWLYQYADCLIQIQSADNTKELTGIDPARIALRRKATAPLSRYLMQGGCRWVLTLYPTQAYAQEAEMALEDYEDFVYSATNVDYAAMEREMRAAAERFNRANQVRIVGKETDLTVDIEGRRAVICAGEHNVPDGEFFFTPNHLRTEGTIYFEWPTIFSGREIQGIRLTFRKGRIVEFSAEKGQPFLEQALNTDEGARYLGELGIGANFGITSPTKDILFDEKIGGSVHLAVGRAYEEAGAGNDSAIHWDMVKNLKEGGRIYLDGELVQENGRWVF
jgi:aminopeptidase